MADQELGYNENKPRRRSKKIPRFFVLLASVAVMMGLAWIITGLIQPGGGGGANSRLPVVSVPASDSQPEEGSSTAPESSPQPADSSAAPDASAPAAEGDGTIENAAWNVVGPVAQAVEEMTLISPDYRMIALPENGRVDMRYFDNVVFVGDSITQGLQIYKEGIPNARYCAYKGVGPKQIYDGSVWAPWGSNEKEVPLDKLAEYNPGIVYVLLGTNIMVGVSDDDIILAYYSEMLDQIMARLPEATIYVQSITPVLQQVDGGRFDMNRIANLNDRLAQLAWEKNLYFLDLHEALAGDDGYLRSDFGASSDGYHMSPSGYGAWVEYMVTHTAYSPAWADMYLENSPYYAQKAPPVTEAE